MITIASNVIVENAIQLKQYGLVDQKRTEVVSVRLTPDDLDEMTRAAELLWPGAVLTKSGIVLGFARLQAEAILASHNKK